MCRFESCRLSVKKTINCQDCPQGYSSEDESTLKIWESSHLKYFPDHRVGEMSERIGAAL